MCDFFIQIDKDFYFAGDMVNGQVFINVHAMLPSATGVSLKFTGYECVKWVEATELHRPRPNPNAPPGTPPPHDPIAAIPPNQLFQHPSESIQVSDVEADDDRSYDHRPKYIRTPSDRHFKMMYFETRNLFTKSNSMIYSCRGMAPGQYCFPFSFKTFEGWPASFQHLTQRKKGVIVYHMSVAIEPQNQQFQLKYGREITLRETRVLSSQTKTSEAQITSCCCMSKGITKSTMHFEKDGYAPGELVQMVMEVENTGCEAAIPTITVSVTNAVQMNSNGRSTSDHGTIFTKSINGLQAKSSATGQNAIRQAFNLQSQGQIRPTCSGKLLSNTYSLNVRMNHDIACQCCSDTVGSSIPIIIFPVIRYYQVPQVFQTNWAPQQMPNTLMVLTNDFNNFQLSQMQQQGQYPPVQQMHYPQQGYSNFEQTESNLR